jgi:regulator of extracellular matrix RemA (YlzA/DUF370 family)
MENSQVVLSALLPETIAGRAQGIAGGIENAEISGTNDEESDIDE